VFARFAEQKVGPPLDGEPEVDAGRREVDELARVVEREMLVRTLAELLELLLVARRESTARSRR
jgi:hypothetical protein